MGKYFKVVPGRAINDKQAFDEIYMVNNDGTPWTPDNPADLAALVTAEGPVKTALSATYGLLSQATVLPASNIVGFVGDSITNASGASSGKGYAQIVRFVAGTRNVDQVYRIYATNGATSTTLLGTNLVSAAAGDAAVVHVAWGTNDAGTGVSVATFSANTIEAHRQITAAGKRMTISLIPPRGSGATAQWRKDRASYNEWISRWAPLANVPVADTSTLIDPATGHLAASCDSGDGTHPNDVGHARIAKTVAATVLKALPAQPRRQVKAPDVNLLPNGTIGTAPASGIPASWAEVAGGTGTAPTYATVADASGSLQEGMWLEMDWTATVGGTRVIRMGGLTKDTGWAVSDQAESAAVIQIEDLGGFAAALEAGTATIDFVMVATDNVSLSATLLPVIRTAAGRIAWRFAMPNTTYPSVALRATLPNGVHAKIRIGEVALFNLTALGVTRSTAGS